MYLWSLEIDVSSYRGRSWLGNPYRVHQRLLMGLPEGLSGVAGERLLFRIEDDRRPPRILVQAPLPADWQAAFDDHPVLLAAHEKHFEPYFAPGQRLRFMLRANPVKRSRETGDRLGLLDEAEQLAWLSRKGEDGGFAVLACNILDRGFQTSRRNPAKDRSRQTHLCIDFEGVLQVTDPGGLRRTIEQGIGPAKAFGFGLLSLART
jgi:CRISPR system Cascade subunit CasE